LRPVSIFEEHFESALGIYPLLSNFANFLKEVARGWGVNPGPLNFIYFLIFTTLPLSHSGSPRIRPILANLAKFGKVWQENSTEEKLN
jgi:hypothetical protein